MTGLSDADRELMAAHAITPAIMDQVRAESGVTGLWWTWAGDGGSVQVKRVPDHLRSDGGKRYEWPGGQTTFPSMIRETGAPRLLIVEGSLQHLAAASWAPEGTDVWGINGIDGIHRKTNLAKAAGRDVWLAPDADRHANPDVEEGAARVTGWLRKAGATSVRLADVPAVAGEHTGFDDWLATLPGDGRTAAIAAMLDAAAEAPASVHDDKREQMPPPAAPLEVARRIAEDYCHPDGQPVLRRWRGEWMTWTGTHYAATEGDGMDKILYERLEDAVCVAKGKDGGQVLVPWAPTRRKVGDVLHALGAVLLLPGDVTAPSWLRDVGLNGVIIAMTDGLLDVATRTSYRHTPMYFSLGSVPFAYDAAAPAPAEWLKFLGQLWPDDPDSVAALQEWFGYVLSGRTDLHKMLMIVGPARGGKGTIARVLQALAGEANCAGPILASLARPFGLEGLLGKSLAVISDVRLGPKTDLHTLAERLLAISGGDIISAERKFRSDSTGRLPVRFMILSNELPSFADVSGALASRFVILTLAQSWLGREDLGLYARLEPELPGILNWALDGLDRLAARGRLTEPESSRDAVIALADAVSPHSAFVRDRCLTGPGLEIPVAQLYAAWQRWCADNGRMHVESKQEFSKRLRAVVPGLKSARPRTVPGDDSAPRPGILYGVALKPVSQLSAPPEPSKPIPGTRWDATQSTVMSMQTNPEVGYRIGDNNGLGRDPARPRQPVAPALLPSPYVVQPPPPVTESNGQALCPGCRTPIHLGVSCAAAAARRQRDGGQP